MTAMYVVQLMLAVCLVTVALGDVHEQVTEAGSHCGNFTGAKHDNSDNESGMVI